LDPTKRAEQKSAQLVQEQGKGAKCAKKLQSTRWGLGCRWTNERPITIPYLKLAACDDGVGSGLLACVLPIVGLSWNVESIEAGFGPPRADGDGGQPGGRC
jgi:hypothetical protein